MLRSSYQKWLLKSEVNALIRPVLVQYSKLFVTATPIAIITMNQSLDKTVLGPNESVLESNDLNVTVDN